MELEEEFKEYIKKYFLEHKQVKSASAFTSIYYIKGYSGRFGIVKSAIEEDL